MKHLFLIAATLLCSIGCTGTRWTHELGGPTVDSALDGSASPLSRTQVLALAVPLVRAREHWREETPNGSGAYYRIFYEALRIDRGAWRIIAKSIEQTTFPPGDEHANYRVSVPAAVIVIDQRGQVVSYTHSANPEFDYSLRPNHALQRTGIGGDADQVILE